jgi:hypothetical protein
MATRVVPLLLIGIAGTPPIIIAVGLLKLVPVIVTRVPTGPVAAEKDIIVGASIKVNPVNDAVPPRVVRLTAPVAPDPTLATIEVDETTVNDVTGVPPNVIKEVPVKFVPVMLMTAPAAAVLGAKDVIAGAGIKVNPVSDAVPPRVVRLTAPVAPVPTIATIDVEETAVNEVTGVPPNVIREVPVRFVPVMLMTAPAAAVTGAKLVIVGAAGGKYVKTQAAPLSILALEFPTIAVLPSALIETL